MNSKDLHPKWYTEYPADEQNETYDLIVKDCVGRRSRRLPRKDGELSTSESFQLALKELSKRSRTRVDNKNPKDPELSTSEGPDWSDL